ncbi:phage tail protein [[Haemophilus] ducreyi]|uniref:phage tail protein n=1 Tax=Haemophilus ducreyi TaxID=730 RepID=UPI000655A905|nr:phage tail protein [[Haemophilus] ducreyi]AKO30575.1 phage tail protein [[Haemophilus] ducreyi]
MGGKRKGGAVTVGYRYYWDIHSGLGRGPVDEIVELRIDDKSAYVGKPNELTHSQAIYIDKPNLFGGENTGGEGGIQGRLEILMGEPDQKPTQMLVNLLKGNQNPAPAQSNSSRLRKAGQRKKQQAQQDFFKAGELTDAAISKDDMIPGFRGIVSTVFSGLISCYNAHPKKHSYCLRRNNKGWHGGAVWYPEKCKIMLRNDTLKISGLTKEQEENVRQIHAMNPAHILVECATNKSWGGKKDLSDLDLDSYKKAADTLYEEGFGLCLRYNRQGSIKEFMQQVIDHIGAVQYDNVETGKQAIRLLRNDYNPDDLPTFHYDNGILMVQDDDSSATDTTANQIIVKWRDPVTNREDQAIANNIASVQMHGVIAKTVEYKGVPTFDLAARLAQRDLEMVASSLTRLKIVFDMRASELKHGDVFKVHLPERGIESAVFRVSAIENGNEGELIVTCMQDVFGLPAANYSTRQSESLYIPPDYTAKPIPRPYPPANVKVDGVFVDKIADSSAFTLTWAHRDRDIQADQLISHTEDSTALGKGVSYKIDLMDGNNIVRSITTDSTTFVYPDEGKIEDEQFSKLVFYTVKDKLTSLYRYEFTVQGAMQLLSDWDYQRAFTQGNDYFNRYDDNDMPTGKYIMLSSSADKESIIYQSFVLEPNKYKRFALSYKIGTYNQRHGRCRVAVQLYKNDELVKEYLSEQFGGWEESLWHGQQVTEAIAKGVSEIRFKVNVIGAISNNAIAFKDIVLRAGG